MPQKLSKRPKISKKGALAEAQKLFDLELAPMSLCIPPETGAILLPKLTGRLPVEFTEKHSMLLAQYKIICPILIAQLNTEMCILCSSHRPQLMAGSDFSLHHKQSFHGN
jgi:hypothetical protein